MFEHWNKKPLSPSSSISLGKILAESFFSLKDNHSNHGGRQLYFLLKSTCFLHAEGPKFGPLHLQAGIPERLLSEILTLLVSVDRQINGLTQRKAASYVTVGV